MIPINIFLVRHGQSLSNVSKKHNMTRAVEVHRTIPDHRIPLTNLGFDQAEAAAKEMRKIDCTTFNWAIYSSPFRRARDTATVIEDTLTDFPGVTIHYHREDPRLREQEWWNYCTKTEEEVMRVIKERDDFGTFYYRFPEGESGADVYNRCATFWSDFFTEASCDPRFPDNVVIVTHSYTMRVLLMHLLQWKVEYFHSVRSPENGQVVHLTQTPGRGKGSSIYKLLSQLEIRKS